MSDLEFIEIEDLVREYTWLNSYNYSMSGKRDEWEEIATRPHRNGELAVFHPLIERFYKDKREPWKVKTDFMGISGFTTTHPVTIDLTSERPAFSYTREYDFNPSRRLALVCNPESEKISEAYFLLPLEQ